MKMPGLRVALLAGGLTQGGAEKQLVYMAGALQREGAHVRVYSLTRGDYYEAALEAIGLPPVWIGRVGNPAARVAAWARALRGFSPHLLQAGHFFANLYVALVAPLYRAAGIGSIRSDVYQEMEANGRWGPALYRMPGSLIANSHAAVQNAAALGFPTGKIEVLPNVIDVAAFDGEAALAPPRRAGEGTVVIAACRLVAAKRIDRLLRAIAIARNTTPALRGLIVGEGPEGPALRQLAGELGLLPDAVAFAGRRNDVAALMRGADIAALTSDHEGFPNVVLEAMAAGLPVVTTRTGDAGVIVEDGMTGYVVDGDPVEAVARKLLLLASDRPLRERLGGAGRAKIVGRYSVDALGGMMLATYTAIAARTRHVRLAAALAPNAGTAGGIA